MSWDFTADDLRKEIKELREKLAVQGVKTGEQETKLLKNEEELRTTRESYADVVSKLRKEADRSLELEEALKRRTEEFRTEKNARENLEEALRAAKEDRERQAASTREVQYYLNRTATESDEHRTRIERLNAEKAKLEAQVRELQGELQRQQTAPPPLSKTPARPRASSPTHLNKVAILERDIEQIRASSSASQIDLKSTHEKMSRLQADLLRAENEKAALEKKLKDQEGRIKDTLADKSELQAELDFYRDQNASHSREDELVARLEEEEAKITLLEQELAKASTSSATKRSVNQLQAQLNREISRREATEVREVQLVQEREEALSEADDLRRTLHDLEASISDRDIRINEFDSQFRYMQGQFESSRQHVASDSMGVDEGKITELMNGIARIRAERDELKGRLDFVQTEAHFKVESLEKKLAEQTASTGAEVRVQKYDSLNTQLASKLAGERHRLNKLHQTVSAMLVVIQHLDAQNDALLRSGADIELRVQSSYNSAMSALQEHLRAKTEEVDRLGAEHRAALATQEEESSELKLRLSDTSSALREEKERRSELAERVRQLEVNLDTVKQELADASEHCERLEARQSTLTSSDGVIKSLKNEIEELRGRVMRRTEQIGLQQHDIKRLETNTRLTDERLEEVLGELEMAETAKAAMLEDCSIAREERDQAKRALMQAELELEQFSARIQDMEREACELRTSLASSVEKEKAGVSERSALSEAVTDRNNRIQILTEKLVASETALRAAEEDAATFRKNQESLHEANQQSIEELQKQMQCEKRAMSEELERRVQGAQNLSKEVEALKLAKFEAEKALEMKNGECISALGEIETLKSNLDAMRTSSSNSTASQQLAHQETKKTLLERDEELKEKTDALHRLALELDHARASREELSRILGAKEEELTATSAELKRLHSEVETDGVKQQETSAILETKERQLIEMREQAVRFETERSELLARISVFEGKAEKELMDSTSLRSILEKERKCHEEKVRLLETELASLNAEKERLKAFETNNNELTARYEETLALLETTKEELTEKQVLCDTLIEKQRRASASDVDEAADLKKEIAALSAEMEALQKSLREEIDGRKQDVIVHQERLQVALDKQESLAAIETELRHSIQQYQQQLAELRENLMALQDENTTLQSEADNLSGECRRANLKAQAAEKELASSRKELSELRDELSRLREAFSKSEKSGKTAEMNLLLITQQHERTITSLRNQLKEHEKDAERIQKLQQIVGETREQISEMEGVLKAKCAEIEENDDKFIQLLKEKKKLASKVESLTRKNNTLQNKLTAALASVSKVVSPRPESTGRQTTASESTRPAPADPEPDQVAFSEASACSPRGNLKVSERAAPSQVEVRKETRRISGSKRRRESTPPLDEISVTTSIGKKRPLPDDSDSGRPPVEARFPDMIRPNAGSSLAVPVASSSAQAPSTLPASDFMATPRQRRPAPRSGFTPVRGHAAALRPTLSQPSPIRRIGGAQALRAAAVISDITNSPPRSKRVFTVEPESAEPRIEKPAGKGWLGKIRGGANPLVRTRQQPKAENQ